MNGYQLEIANQDLVRERLARAQRDHLAREVPLRSGRLRIVLTGLVHAMARRERRTAVALG